MLCNVIIIFLNTVYGSHMDERHSFQRHDIKRSRMSDYGVSAMLYLATNPKAIARMSDQVKAQS